MSIFKQFYMEDWLKDAKELAKSEAEYFVESLIGIAHTNNLDTEWFVAEVVKNIHKIKSNPNESD